MGSSCLGFSVLLDLDVCFFPLVREVSSNYFFKFISNKYLVKRQSRDYDVEWGYAFDVHLNAFYPLLVILHFIQLFFINHVILTDTFIGYFVGNTLWLVAVGYYIYVTFLGYSALGWNFTHTLCSFYKYRVK
ncbi:protein unc-50 homolog isoform X2 [Halichoerus grypus]